MIIDAVIHAYNFDESNLVHERYSPRFARGTYSHHRMWSPPDSEYVLTEDEFITDFDEEASAHAVFAESPVDMAVYHATPIYDFFKDGLVSLEKGARLKERYPERVLLYGTVSLLDAKQAIADLERQVRDYRIDGVKFYPAVFVDGKTIRASLADPETAFPVLERAGELGIRNAAVHKALPLGPTESGPYHVDDLAAAAVAFPDMNFQIVHAGLAFTEETAMLLARFPNVYANLEGTFGAICQAPRAFYESVGKMAEWGSWEQILFASGCNVAHPRPLIERFEAAEMPADLVAEHGYPSLDDDAKALVLGGNLARLHGLEGKQPPNDDFSRERAENPRPWTVVRAGAGAR